MVYVYILFVVTGSRQIIFLNSKKKCLDLSLAVGSFILKGQNFVIFYQYLTPGNRVIFLIQPVQFEIFMNESYYYIN